VAYGPVGYGGLGEGVGVTEGYPGPPGSRWIDGSATCSDPAKAILLDEGLAPTGGVGHESMATSVTARPRATAVRRKPLDNAGRWFIGDTNGLLEQGDSHAVSERRRDTLWHWVHGA
jgi:hypothetical protein